MRHKNPSGADFFLGNPVWSDDLFRGLKNRAAKRLKRVSGRVRVTAGAVLFSRGEKADAVYTLVSGEALLLVETGSGRALSRHISAGEVFGLPEAVAEAPYETTVTAVTDCEFRAIRSADFSFLLHLDPGLSFKLVQVLGSNLNAGRQLLASLGT